MRVRRRTVLERLGTGLLGDPAAMVTLSREAHRGINPSDLRGWLSLANRDTGHICTLTDQL